MSLIEAKKLLQRIVNDAKTAADGIVIIDSVVGLEQHKEDLAAEVKSNLKEIENLKVEKEALKLAVKKSKEEAAALEQSSKATAQNLLANAEADIAKRMSAADAREVSVLSTEQKAQDRLVALKTEIGVAETELATLIAKRDKFIKSLSA